jgi:hypothetical protein
MSGMSEPTPEQQHQQVVVVGPDGRPIGAVDLDENGNVSQDPDGDRGPAELIEQPAKVMRIGSMVKQLLEEVRQAPLDDAARERLRQIHHSSVAELGEGLAPELREELDRLTLPFSETATPSDAELRIAQAQLVGWLEGLFHGIQTALFAQQMAARVQLEQMRGRQALPGAPGLQPGAQQPGSPGHHGTGQYL